MGVALKSNNKNNNNKTNKNPKCILDLKIRAKTIKILEEFVGENLCGHRGRKDLLDKIQKDSNPKNQLSGLHQN